MPPVPSPVAAPVGPTFRQMLGRAVRLRCPWCGGRPTFVYRWFRRRPRCPSCGIRWRREPGAELAAATVNMVATFALMTVVMGVALVLTLPDVPVLPVTLALCATGVAVAIALHPFAMTVWVAIDLALHRPDAGELAKAAEAARVADRTNT